MPEKFPQPDSLDSMEGTPSTEELRQQARELRHEVDKRNIAELEDKINAKWTDPELRKKALHELHENIEDAASNLFTSSTVPAFNAGVRDYKRNLMILTDKVGKEEAEHFVRGLIANLKKRFGREPGVHHASLWQRLKEKGLARFDGFQAQEKLPEEWM